MNSAAGAVYVQVPNINNICNWGILLIQVRKDDAQSS